MFMTHRRIRVRVPPFTSFPARSARATSGSSTSADTAVKANTLWTQTRRIPTIRPALVNARRGSGRASMDWGTKARRPTAHRPRRGVGHQVRVAAEPGGLDHLLLRLEPIAPPGQLLVGDVDPQCAGLDVDGDEVAVRDAVRDEAAARRG